MSYIVWWLGLVAQTVGLGLAIFGLFATERTYLRPGQRWRFQGVVDAAKTTANKTRHYWAIITRRRKSATVHAVSGEVHLSGVATATAGVGYGTYPGATVEEKVAKLEEAMRRAEAQALELNGEISRQREDVRQVRVELETMTAELKRQTDEAVSKLATSGVLLTAIGLFITLLGTVASAMGQSPFGAY